MGASLLSPTHLVVLALVGLLLFGAKRLPEVGRSLGSGMREFKASVTGLADMDAPSAVGTVSETHAVGPLTIAEAHSAQPEDQVAHQA
jgi:sec-independent protein translocase protein TatA